MERIKEENGDGEPALCCCEYRSERGERSHLLALCCDCDDFDKLVDGMIVGAGADQDRLAGFISTAEDRIRIPWRGGALRLPVAALTPCILIPAVFWICSLHPYLLLSFLVLIPLFLYKFARIILRLKPKTKLFFNTSITLSVYLIYLYEVKLVGLFWDLPKIVSPVENLVLVAGCITSSLLYRRVRWQSRSRKLSGSIDTRFCRICNYNVAGKDHHCIWLDVCISEGNQGSFIVFIFLLSLTSLHAALIFSSSVCPGKPLGPLVIPGACWPDNKPARLLLVAGIFSGVLSILLVLLFVQQLYTFCVRLKVR